MTLNSENFRAIIFYNFRRGLTQQQCIDDLNSIFGDEAPSRTSIYRWYGEFNRGRSSRQDEFREGRPKSVVANSIFSDEDSLGTIHRTLNRIANHNQFLFKWHNFASHSSFCMCVYVCKIIFVDFFMVFCSLFKKQQKTKKAKH